MSAAEKGPCALDGLVHPPTPQWPCYRTNANPQEPPVTPRDFPPHESVVVSEFPPCDICRFVERRPEPRLAQYDARTHTGSWANCCAPHFVSHAGKLGLGLGQRLLIRREDVMA